MSHQQDLSVPSSSSSRSGDNPSKEACRIVSPVGVVPMSGSTETDERQRLYSSSCFSPIGSNTTSQTHLFQSNNNNNSKSSEVVVLNVGGFQFTTTRSTLFSAPGSILEAMFSGRHAFCALQMADGAYFIDRDGSHFRHILNFLRTGCVVTLPNTDAGKQELAVEADFYGLEGLVKAIRMPTVDVSDHLSDKVLSQREKETELRAKFSSRQANGMDPYEGLISIFCPDDGISFPLLYNPECDTRKDQDCLFMADVCVPRNPPLADPRPPVCVESIEAFRTNFNKEWPNILHRIDEILREEPVVIAGGAVLRALTASDNIRTGGKKMWCDGTSDIDVFLYASTPEEANRICRRIFYALAVGDETWVVIRSRGVINIHELMDGVKTKVQIVLRLYDSPSEVLLGFDVDCCLCAYNGRDVWLAPRCISALESGTNILNPLHAWPNSASYEIRLAKYAARGFPVSVPGLDKPRIDYDSIHKSNISDLKGMARFIKVASEMDSAAPLKRYVWPFENILRTRTPRQIANLRDTERSGLTDDERVVDVLPERSLYDEVDHLVVPGVYGISDYFAWVHHDIIDNIPTALNSRDDAWEEIVDAGETSPERVPRRLVDSWDTAKRSREYLNGKMDKFDLDSVYYSACYKDTVQAKTEN